MDMSKITNYKCWIGKKKSFEVEVRALLKLLQNKVLTEESNLFLSPELSSRFDWIGESELTAQESKLFPVTGGHVALQTSGTTSTPKIVWKNCNEVLQNKRGHGSFQDTWLLTYNPGRWAGLSVLLHVLKTGAKLVVPEDLSISCLMDKLPSATHISLTPSLFKKLMMTSVRTMVESPITQLTLGGEYATQKILNDAKLIWPNARITHIYATTELGDVCACSDGKEGIPVDKLNREVSFSEQGELILDKVNNTGDLWEQRDGRLYFKGRSSEVISVGGAKVTQSHIENIVNGFPEISECRAYPIESSFLGQIVGLDYVGTLSPTILKKRLSKILPRYAVPVKMNQVECITLTSAGKISRRL